MSAPSASAHKVKITEVSGDLFTASKEYSIGHCVSADLRMGKGIAVKFRQDFSAKHLGVSRYIKFTLNMSAIHSARFQL